MIGSPGTRPAPDLPPGPRAALVIATASYQDPGLDQLRATADDAKALTEVLGDPGIGGFAVTPVIDADERRVRRVVGEFLSGRGTGDVVLVYLSCHGVLDRRSRLYFAAADTVKDQLGGTGIPAGWLVEQLEECRARQQVVILDCCFSGAFAKGSKGDSELDLERRLAGNARGRAVLTASRSGEYSFTGDALPGAAVSGSVFTAGLVEGLRTGAADAGGDGYVSVDEAYDFAYRHVLSLGVGQTPQRWLSGGEGAIVLARSPAGIAVTPASLPGELADALESRYPAIRIGAVHELGGWLAGADPGRVMAAGQKLLQIADNDNQAVAAAARDYLAGPGQAITRTSPHSRSTARDESTAAAPAGKVPEPVRKIPDRVIWLLADAEHAARSITGKQAKARALIEIAMSTVEDGSVKLKLQSPAMADRAAWEQATRQQRHLAVAADAELRRRRPGQPLPPLRSAEPQPATQAQRDELTLSAGEEIPQLGQWIKDLAARHHAFAGKLAERQNLTITAEDPDREDLRPAFPGWKNAGRDAILQPPRPQIQPSAQILERAAGRDLDMEAAG